MSVMEQHHEAVVRRFPKRGPVMRWPLAVKPVGQQRITGRAVGIAAVVAVIVTLAVGLAVYSAAASYESVSHLAGHLGIPLHRLTPLGIDGGLFGVIAFDILLTLAKRPIWWLRWAGRLFAVGVLAANAAAGWPDLVDVGLRCGAPLLFVFIVEAARTVMLGRAGHLSSDRIPRLRWLLDFGGTFALWRRMKLWGERSYTAAVGMELDRLSAIERLAMHYAPAPWESSAPADLVWMLTSGVRMGEALSRVSGLIDQAAVDAAWKREMTAQLTAVRGEMQAQYERAETAEAGQREALTQVDDLTAKLAAASRKASASRNRPRKAQGSKAEDLTTELRALKLLEDEPELRQPRMGGELARKLGVSPATGRRLHSQLAGRAGKSESLSERTTDDSGERS